MGPYCPGGVHALLCGCDVLCRHSMRHSLMLRCGVVEEPGRSEQGTDKATREIGFLAIRK